MAIQAEDILVALGEVAAAFAGFSGVVAALGFRSMSELPAVARFRFENLLVFSVAAALLAFLPVALGQFPISEAAVWSFSSASLGVLPVVFLAVRLPRFRRIGTADPESLSSWMAWLTLLTFVVVSGLQATNVLGWPAARGGGPYVAGILALLFLSGLQFILLALRSASPAR